MSSEPRSSERDSASSADRADAGGERFTGSSLERVEDHRLLTGRAEFVHDRTPEDAVHMALVRSVHAHADIVSVDTARAEAHPDCALVLTGEDVRRDYNPMPAGLEGFEEWSLASDRVRYAGEPVVAVFAADRYAAEDVAERVRVEYDPLEPVVDPMAAREDETLVNESVGTNVPDREVFEFGDPDAGPTLVLNGHVDVVPAGDPNRWTVPPWRATVRAGRVYGRGAADMKGGLCCALYAVRALRAAGVELAVFRAPASCPLIAHCLHGSRVRLLCNRPAHGIRHRNVT